MTIAIAGDLFIPPGVEPAADDGLSELLKSCTTSLVNLEGVLAKGLPPAFKTGPRLEQSLTVPQYVADIGFTGVTLANNHSMDFGGPGLEATVARVEAVGLKHVGSLGPSGGHAVLLVEEGNFSVAILNVCEDEWARPKGGDSQLMVYDTVETGRRVRSLADAGHVVVLVVHGGNEYFALPNPTMRDKARFMVEMGAGAVVHHHAHVFSGYEYWEGAPIAYGLGNFQFAARSSKSGFYEGLVAVLSIVGEGLVEMTLTPVTTDASNFSVRFAGEPLAGDMRRQVSALSQTLQSDTSLTASWDEFVREQAQMYIQAALPLGSQRGRVVRGLANRVQRRYATARPEDLAILLNALRCSSHRSALTQLITSMVETR